MTACDGGAICPTCTEDRLDREIAWCLPGTDAVMTCVDTDLLAAWNARPATIEDGYVTLGQLFRDALIDFLRSIGKLPPPYV